MEEESIEEVGADSAGAGAEAVEINNEEVTSSSTKGNDVGGRVGSVTPARRTKTKEILKTPTSRNRSGSGNQLTTRMSFLSAVELQVFRKFVENYKRHPELRREDAIALDFMFGHTMHQVFEIIQDDRVTIRQSPVSRRVLVEVCGKKSGDVYWIPPGHSLCQCPAYIHGRNNKEYCKHVLAAHFFLAIAPKDNYKAINDEELSAIYKECLQEALGLGK